MTLQNQTIPKQRRNGKAPPAEQKATTRHETEQIVANGNLLAHSDSLSAPSTESIQQTVIVPAELTFQPAVDLTTLSLEELSASDRIYNRELSWLSFNWRVLQEAIDERTPLLERLKFIAIT